jgi:purine-binding chemotaxis protein CheW
VTLVRLVRFRAGDLALALGVEQVREVVRVRDLARVPGAPPAIVGLMSFRGSVLGIVDAGLRLGGRSCDRTSSGARVLALDHPAESFGVLCEEVAGCDWIDASKLANPPVQLVERHGSCVRSVFTDTAAQWLVLDAARLVEASP